MLHGERQYVLIVVDLNICKQCVQLVDHFAVALFPECPVRSEERLQIMADNRMLWRVFENLMNNIYKYAQKDTRVYLNAETVIKDGKEWVEITFKNVSKYALDIPPQELMERFVRGDSRHTEGSGLGLSIVGSLMELQGGRLMLATDGDLFKAILCFPK